MDEEDDDAVVVETNHGRYESDTYRYQFAMERTMYEEIKARAALDGVRDADVARSAMAAYLGWPMPYVHPRPGRWTKQTTPNRP